MSISNRNSRALVAASLLLGSLWNPVRVDARRWTEYLHTGTNIIKQGIQMRNAATGGGYEGGGGYHQSAPPQQAPEAPSAPNSPGSNYYNIDPSTMRNPLRRAQPEPPQEQPTYSQPPSYQRPYSSRSAYHTGSDTGSEREAQQVNIRIPNYAAAKKPMHAHATVKRVDRPEKAAVAVDHPTSKPLFFEKPEIKPATTFDTSWIMPAFDRMETKLRSKG